MTINKIKKKQIDSSEIGSFMASGFSVSGNNSDDVTSALSINDKNGNAFPMQVTNAALESEGFITGTNASEIDILNSATKKRVVNGVNDEIYGKLTESSGVYTLSYYYRDKFGNEYAQDLDASDMPEVTSIDFIFRYVSNWDKIPNVAKQGFISNIIANDPAQLGGRTVLNKLLNITALNTAESLPDAPYSESVAFVLNGVKISSGITISGAKDVAIDPAIVGYNVETTDSLSVEYVTNEVK